ncbi:NAD-dependent epimerase/dehydratase [Beutenbergia cavernae DSM 12333]|uniref:NAD-dependent epimerase/dehydratase n=1 Tax=Beutenbergia cavernae (strain ATCC BAA-8 / DSM 12333 / CCUG 43141 / JCM 11478 / NBRC 16432 / NCIMB 13614 / HKI 0122) TaxID=471853 RepID=C5C003_BEUC1|nr:NAD-dependent epimerase/dehydratase family protein [Beutenbergia cavernae]ACQ81333.1 NAD-dependent epimerase/dehydratase [Beutenbergia cavernae DSM 12333]
MLGDVRILLTGGLGFIGSPTRRALVAAGHDIVVLDRADTADRKGRTGRTEPAPPPVPDGVEVIRADVRDLPAVRAATTHADAVVHLAAKVGLGVSLADLDDYVSVNDLGTAVVLRAAAEAGVGDVVLASSMVVYGEGRYTCTSDGVVAPLPRRAADLEAGEFEPRCPHCGGTLEPGLVTEDAALDPRNVYAATKVHDEHLLAVWARETGARATALRFHNVYGPGMPADTPYAGVASIFASELAAGRPPRVTEDGAQRRDFVHVDDVADAVVATLSRPGTPGTLRALNVGSGRVTTVGELAAALADARGGPRPVVTGSYRLGDVRHVAASSERAARELGWRARIALADGVADL